MSKGTTDQVSKISELTHLKKRTVEHVHPNKHYLPTASK